MPIGPYDTFEACVIDQQSKGYDPDAAARICGEMEEDAEVQAEDSEDTEDTEDKDSKNKTIETVMLMLPEEEASEDKEEDSEDKEEDSEDKTVGASSTPADSFVIFPRGVMKTSKGNFLFDDKAAEMIMSEYEDQGMDLLPIDFDHGMLTGEPTPDSSSAAGWFIPAVEERGLVATEVKWTPRALGMLKDREFRHYSPAFDVDTSDEIDVDGEVAYRVTKLVNVALTNLPASKDQIPLVASAVARGITYTPPTLAKKETESMHLHKLFGLTDEAALAQQATRLLSAVPGAKSLADVVANIKLLKAQAAESVHLAQRVASLESEKLANSRNMLISKLSEQGKAPPSIHSFLRTLSLSQVETFAKCAPAVAQQGSVGSTALSSSIKLSSEDEHVLSLMPNITREQFLSERQREATKSNNKKAG